MNKNIFGSIESKDEYQWTYEGTIGDPIKSPVTGSVRAGTGNQIIITYTNKCTFSITIDGIKWNTTNAVSESEQLGTAVNNKIILKIQKGNENFKIKDFFNEEGVCFEEKTETEKNTTTNKSSSNRSTAIYDPYEVAAWPFYGIQGGMKALKGTFGLKTKKNESFERINEDIERIKQLMK